MGSYCYTLLGCVNGMALVLSQQTLVQANHTAHARGQSMTSMDTYSVIFLRVPIGVTVDMPRTRGCQEPCISEDSALCVSHGAALMSLGEQDGVKPGGQHARQRSIASVWLRLVASRVRNP